MVLILVRAAPVNPKNCMVVSIGLRLLEHGRTYTQTDGIWKESFEWNTHLEGLGGFVSRRALVFVLSRQLLLREVRSCAASGMSRREVPPLSPSSSSHGKCSRCGMVKLYDHVHSRSLHITPNNRQPPYSNRVSFTYPSNRDTSLHLPPEFRQIPRTTSAASVRSISHPYA